LYSTDTGTMIPKLDLNYVRCDPVHFIHLPNLVLGTYLSQPENPTKLFHPLKMLFVALPQGNYSVFMQLSNWLGYMGSYTLSFVKLPDSAGPVPQLVINGPYEQVSLCTAVVYA
jgi:hypothetical protein